MTDPIASGDYARKQIYCPNPVVAWSHGSRFALAARLASAHAGGALLDYGCGDGTFIALTHGTFSAAVGADYDRGQLEDCRRRLGHLDAVRFVETGELSAASDGGFDVVTCMEVLEHCTEPQRAAVIADLRRLVRPAGRIIVSVPIETGPALAAKQLFRAIAAWRGQGDYRYRETYTPGELLGAVTTVAVPPHVEYGVDGVEEARRYRGHKGFDWRVVEADLRRAFTIEARLFSPVPLLGRVLNSQVWFVCHPR